MTQIALSDDLIEITAEINSFKQVAGQSLFEIGKRLKHVKEKDMAHGQWTPWLKSIDIEPRTAQRMIQAYEQFGNTSHASLLPTGKIFEMLSLPESVDRQEFVQQPQVVPTTGEQKTVNDMSRDELREVKKALQEAERRAAQAEATATTAQNSAVHFEKLFNSIKNQPPKIETKTVEVLPADYKLLKDTAQEHQRLNVENVQLKRTLDEQRQRYESMLSTENHRKQAVKELKKMCGEMVSSFAQYRKLVMMSFQLTSNDREACQIFEAFSNELESEVRIMFEEIQKGTAIRAV